MIFMQLMEGCSTMLRFNIRGENIEVTQAIRDYTEKKVSKIERYFNRDLTNVEAHVNLKTYTDKTAKVEVTVPLPNVVLRAEETSPDMYGSIDLVADKLERQIRKYKTKVNRKNRRQNLKRPEAIDPDLWAEDIPGLDDDHEDDVSSSIVRTKQVDLTPMSPEEAVLQMDMLGHDFFIFEDSETEGVSVVYKRHDDQYGLLET